MILSKQKTALFFRLSISITVFGALFKFMSWPLIILGATGMIVFHSIQLYQKEDRTVLDYSRHALILFFSINYILSILNMPYAHISTLLTKVSLIAFIMVYVKQVIGSLQDIDQNALLLPQINRENLSHQLADMATVYIVIASLFTILNWDMGIINANVLLVIGLFSAVISILAGSKRLSN